MKRTTTLPILTFGHFLVDLACLYFFFANYPQSGFVAGIGAALLYNFLAFALQAPIGYFFDRFPARRSTTIGILFVLCGYACGLLKLSAAGLILCGFGNAFYHVGGSIGIARTDKKGLKDSGIFVSAGALGVSLGTWFANDLGLTASFLSATSWCLLLLLVVLLLLQQKVVSPTKPTVNKFSPKTNTTLLLLALFAVFLRSLGGLFFPTAYKSLFHLPAFPELSLFLVAMSSGIVAFLGKFLGGFLSGLCTRLLQKIAPGKSFDLRTGNYIFGATLLLLSILLLWNAHHVPILAYIDPAKPARTFLGILCFHAVMPVTLFELYCILPNHPGFAMGLSTVMLFLGYLPYEFISLEGLPAGNILLLLTLLATACMVISLLIYRNACSKLNKEETP